MSTLVVKQINKRGQLSIGKKYAGKKVQIDEYPDGSVILRPIEIISEFELQLLRDRTFHDRLDAFDHWAIENKPVETDLSIMEENFEA